MLANDTIESSGAGDLIVGWSQASADFLERDDRSDDDDKVMHNNNNDNNTGVIDGELICGFGNRRVVPVSTPEDRVIQPTTSTAASESENSSNYFLGVLARRLSTVPFWFKTLESETTASKRSKRQEARIDMQSSVGITRAIPMPNPIQ
jgi:hypothetical protein